jgi:hypothetical protein
MQFSVRSSQTKCQSIIMHRIYKMVSLKLKYFHILPPLVQKWIKIVVLMTTI